MVPLGHVDNRSDKEIVHALSEPRAVTSQKNVWAFWDTGFQAMRKWNQRNVINWIRMLGPEWNVRVLDLVEGSESNIRNFLDVSCLPACLADGTMTGVYAGQHAADMVRLRCLFEHGGVWLDVGIILFMHLDQVCWKTIANPMTKTEVALASVDPSLITGLVGNFFIASQKGNGFIRRWMEVFFEVWRGRSECQGLHTHPLFEHLVKGNNMARDFQLASEDKLDYFGMQLSYERVRLLEDPQDGFSGYNYGKNRILLLEHREFASAAMLAQDDGLKQLKYMSTHYDQTLESRNFDEAWKYCEQLFCHCAMVKLYHWKDDHALDGPTLADLWNTPGNEDADRKPGTFAELMRFVSSHFTQKRKLNGCKFPPLVEKALVASLLEAPEY